ncbi:MAG: DNA cytosine methyltransferase, partial [Clostridia bacterium]
MAEQLKSIDLFAGIGGIRLGFENAFGDGLKTVFACEWDPYAQKTYFDNFSSPSEIAGDITKIDEQEIPAFDICLAGFPCQAFSLAGQRKGFEDDYKGLCRGTLFMEVARICEKHQPKVIFCENVKGLVAHDKGRTLDVIKKTFADLGYKVFSDVLNSKDFGVPQNRERIYIVAFRNDIAPECFDFQSLPKKQTPAPKIRDILEESAVSVKYYLSTTYMETLRRHRARHEAKGNGFGYEIRDLNGIAGAIVCGGMGRERNLIIDERLTNFTPITHIKGTVNREGIRKMTPREWARLQGFPDTFQLNLADVHLYKQFGNSVTVPVVEAIAKKIKEVLEMDEKSGNKGEWSEIYAFMKLLKDGKIFAAKEN